MLIGLPMLGLDVEGLGVSADTDLDGMDVGGRLKLFIFPLLRLDDTGLWVF